MRLSSARHSNVDRNAKSEVVFLDQRLRVLEAHRRSRHLNHVTDARPEVPCSSQSQLQTVTPTARPTSCATGVHRSAVMASVSMLTINE